MNSICLCFGAGADLNPTCWSQKSAKVFRSRVAPIYYLHMDVVVAVRKPACPVHCGRCAKQLGHEVAINRNVRRLPALPCVEVNRPAMKGRVKANTWPLINQIAWRARLHIGR